VLPNSKNKKRANFIRPLFIFKKNYESQKKYFKSHLSIVCLITSRENVARDSNKGEKL